MLPFAARLQSRRRFAQSLRRTRNVARAPKFIDLVRVLKTILGTNTNHPQPQYEGQVLYKAASSARVPNVSTAPAIASALLDNLPTFLDERWQSDR